MVKHCAKYSDAFLPIFANLLRGCDRVLDPFAGTGKLAYIRDYGFRGEVWVNDLEPEWISQTPWWAHVTVSDAEHLPFLDGYFDAICTSPVYGNRLSDHHDAKDASRRNGYKFALGRDLAAGNTGAMQWGEEYRRKHEAVWRECKRVLADGGPFVLNISDHIRKGAGDARDAVAHRHANIAGVRVAGTSQGAYAKATLRRERRDKG